MIRAGRAHLTAAALGLAALAACDSPVSSLPQGCDLAAEEAVAKPSLIAVLAAAGPQAAPELGAERTEAIRRILCVGFGHEARLIGDTVGRGVGDSRLWADLVLRAEGENPLMQAQNAQAKVDRVLEEVAKLLNERREGPIDVLGALAVLDGHLGAARDAPVHVVILSDMLNGTPVLALTDPRTLERDPYDLLEGVERAGLVPDCRGWQVHIVGAGRTGQGGVGSTQAARLRDFWALLFDRCGGSLVAYQSQLVSFPADGPPLRPPAPGVRVSGEDSATVAISVPANVLFGVDQSHLQADAERALSQALAVIGRHAAHAVEVAGHTDSDGSAERNQELSERRAVAVAEWLRANGVASERIRSVGYGADRPVSPNETPEGRQQNRRVEIRLHAPT